MDLSTNKNVIRRYIDMWNTGHADLADEILAPDYVDHAHPEVSGPAAVRQSLQRVRAAFPDFHITCVYMVSEEDMVAWRGQISRTVEGKATTSHVIWLARIAHGQMAELWTGTEAAR